MPTETDRLKAWLDDTEALWNSRSIADEEVAPPMFRALRAVVELHTEAPEPTWCGEKTCAYCHNEDGELNRWPCATIRAIEKEVLDA